MGSTAAAVPLGSGSVVALAVGTVFRHAVSTHGMRVVRSIATAASIVVHHGSVLLIHGGAIVVLSRRSTVVVAGLGVVVGLTRIHILRRWAHVHVRIMRWGMLIHPGR